MCYTLALAPTLCLERGNFQVSLRKGGGTENGGAAAGTRVARGPLGTQTAGHYYPGGTAGQGYRMAQPLVTSKRTV